MLADSVLESLILVAQHYCLQSYLRSVGSGCLPSLSQRPCEHSQVLKSALNFQPFSVLAKIRYIADLARKASLQRNVPLATDDLDIPGHAYLK